MAKRQEQRTSYAVQLPGLAELEIQAASPEAAFDAYKQRMNVKATTRKPTIRKLEPLTTDAD